MRGEPDLERDFGLLIDALLGQLGTDCVEIDMERIVCANGVRTWVNPMTDRLVIQRLSVPAALGEPPT